MSWSYTKEDMLRSSRTGGGPLQAIKKEINESVVGKKPKIFFFSDAEAPHEAGTYSRLLTELLFGLYKKENFLLFCRKLWSKGCIFESIATNEVTSSRRLHYHRGSSRTII